MSNLISVIWFNAYIGLAGMSILVLNLTAYNGLLYISSPVYTIPMAIVWHIIKHIKVGVIIVTKLAYLYRHALLIFCVPVPLCVQDSSCIYPWGWCSVLAHYTHDTQTGSVVPCPVLTAGYAPAYQYPDNFHMSLPNPFYLRDLTNIIIQTIFRISKHFHIL